MRVIDKAFSIHDDALVLRSQRSSILAANIANADTPTYKARDMDFQAMMRDVQNGNDQAFSLAQTNKRHLPASAPTVEPNIKYRNPLQASLDGNTVDMHAEQARFSKNAFEYQTSLTLLNSKIRGLLFAIKGQ